MTNEELRYRTSYAVHRIMCGITAMFNQFNHLRVTFEIGEHEEIKVTVTNLLAKVVNIMEGLEEDSDTTSVTLYPGDITEIIYTEDIDSAERLKMFIEQQTQSALNALLGRKEND